MDEAEDMAAWNFQVEYRLNGIKHRLAALKWWQIGAKLKLYDEIVDLIKPHQK